MQEKLEGSQGQKGKINGVQLELCKVLIFQFVDSSKTLVELEGEICFEIFLFFF